MVCGGIGGRMLFVLDSSGIFRSNLNLDSESSYIIPNSVLLELHDETIKDVINSKIRQGVVKILDPCKESLKKTADAARETGDLDGLSEADLDVIALALEHKATIISDDYRIQNVASALGLHYETVSQDGIKRKVKWVKFCRGCNKTYVQSDSIRECPVCGLRLTRKMLKQD